MRPIIFNHLKLRYTCAVAFSVGRLFARNPFPAVAKLMDQVVACADHLPSLIELLIDDNQPALQDKCRLISKLEGQADEAKNRAREGLGPRLLLPVDRRDVLTLLNAIDDIADAAEDVGVLLSLRALPVPDEMAPLLREFTAHIMGCIHLSDELVKSLDALVSSGFRGLPAKSSQEIVERLARREHEADKVQDQLAKLVLKREEELTPVPVFMWLKVLQEMGNMANSAERVGDRFRLFTAS